MSEAVLAIDQGTTATKALVVAVDGTVLADAEQAVPVRAAGDGAVEIIPQDLWESVVAAGRAAIAQAGVPIRAVGLANQGESVLAWDHTNGEALTPCLVWQDRRSAQICEDLRPAGDRLAAISGLRLDPYFSAPKMRWIRDKMTERGVVTTTDTWLLHRLTGEFVTDVSTASRSMLLDVDTLEWSDEAWDLFGLDEPRPRLARSDETIGTTSAFGATVPVGGTIVDQQAALWAQGARERGQSKCTYGTGAFLLANTGDTATRSPAGLATSVAWRLTEQTRYCLDGQLYAVGAAFAWLNRLGLLGGAQEIETILTTTPHSGDVVFVPALAGLGAPHWQPDARAAFLGMSLSTTREHLVRAVCESIAAHVAELAGTVAAELRQPLTALRVDGGLTRSPAFLQLQADVAGVPIVPCHSPHATAFGVADLATRTAYGHGIAEIPSAPTVGPHARAGWATELIERWRTAVALTSNWSTL
ncbi:FGGY family carbohydrate kinase [Micromonospora sp. NPDC050200]|uniref:FGGY family carbohydrate kinase n=1 Tax=Micromonospora sp. NPDC050200 TaxID=3155664 RepID=UPI00340FBBFB